MEETSECTDMSINPFEAESTDSLHLSKFSPSIFKIKTPSSTKKSPTFRWSIDQLAILKPADIDEAPHQQDIQLDQDTEQRIQQAIDEFFSQKQVAPSPWSAGKPTKHVTFSPHPPSTNYYDVRSADTSAASSCDTSLTNDKPSMVDACSQTSLTLPLDFDLHALLASYYSYQQGSTTEILSTSSLRRKLFLPAGSTTTESDSSISMNCVQSSRCESGIFPEKNLSLSPINSIRKKNFNPGREPPNTPASAKSQFSSSPKSTPSFTPVDKRYASIISSDMDSPPISPIAIDALESHRGWMHPLENTPCGKTKCLFYLSAPEVSPIPCITDGMSSSIKSSNKGKENRIGPTQKLKSNMKDSSLGNPPRGAVAKLNLMTVLDKPAAGSNGTKPDEKTHPFREGSAEELTPRSVPNTECILHNDDQKRSKQLDVVNGRCEVDTGPCISLETTETDHGKIPYIDVKDVCELQTASCSSSETVDADHKKLPYIDASMVDYEESTDTFDIDHNEEYLTSTMRRENEQKGFDFPDSDVCSLIDKVETDDMSCNENMDIS